MTFPIFGSECAPGILDIRPAAEPGIVSSNAAGTDLLRLFALDNLPAARRQLVCHWRRDADGRLSCSWEPDIAPHPESLIHQSAKSREWRPPMSATELCKAPRHGAVLDDAHIGDIRGAFGTIRQGDIAPRSSWWAPADAARDPRAGPHCHGRR